MLRSVDDWDGQLFAFRESVDSAHAADKVVVSIDDQASGPVATIPDAHLLFTADFTRAGADLILRGDDGKSVVVHDYFATEKRATLLSPEGAALAPDVIAALAGPQAPGQYAQAGGTQANAEAVGRVAVVTGNATIVRNGVAMAAQTGDAILKGDVLQTGSGSLGVTFNDGSTLNLTDNARLVVNEFIYDPNGAQNSQLLNLVQGSLTFISGQVAHTGDMKIATPVATMGIRGTDGGVEIRAADGTVKFYVRSSETGAVLTDARGNVLAQVTQSGPVIEVRPVGPLQVLAQEIGKTPAELQAELNAFQQLSNVHEVGQQLIQQFFQQDQQDNQNPQQNGPNHSSTPPTIIGTQNIFNNDNDGPATVEIVTTPIDNAGNFGPTETTGPIVVSEGPNGENPLEPTPVQFSPEVHWTGAGGDNSGNNPNNWDQTRAPTASDDVFVETPTAVIFNDPVEVHSLTLSQGAQVTANAITTNNLDILGDGGQNSTVLQSGGSLTIHDLAGNVFVSAESTFAEIQADNDLVFEDIGGSFTIESGPILTAEVTAGRNLTIGNIGGNFFNGGTISALLGVLTIGTVGGTFVNARTLSAHELHIASSADEVLQNEGSLSVSGASDTASTIAADTHNTGDIEVLLGAYLQFGGHVENADGGIIRGRFGGSVDFDGTVANSGTIQADFVGTVGFNGETSNDGTIGAERGGHISFDGDLHNSGHIFAGPIASIDFGDGSVDNSGTIEAKSDGDIDFIGTVTNSGTIKTDGGSIYLNTLDNTGGHLLAAGNGIITVASNITGGDATIEDGTVEFLGAAYGVAVTFASGFDSDLTLGDLQDFAGSLSGFDLGDYVNFVGLDLVVGGYDSDTGVLTLADGHQTFYSLIFADASDYSINNFLLEDDGAGGSQLSYVSEPVPVAMDAAASGDEDTVIYGTVADADDTRSGLTYVLTGENGGAQHGTVTMNADGTFTYTPFTDSNNADSFRYHITDGTHDSNDGIVSIDVVSVNDAPSIVDRSSTGGVPAGVLTAAAAAYLVAGHDLIDTLGGTHGFGESILPANDDGSTGAIDLTSVFGSEGLNFFGHTYTSLWINNNGNVTFGSPFGGYTPTSINAGFSNPIVAPFWADVDTRGGPIPAPGADGNSTGSNLVYYDLDADNHVLTVTWDDVGYYAGHTGLANAFQLQLIGLGDGDFDIVFRYEDVNWTTGDASGGFGGLGGNIARAGYSAGDGNPDHYFELPQSGDQAQILALEDAPGNTFPAINGVDVFEVRSGTVTEASVAQGEIQFTDPDGATDTHTASFVADNSGLHDDSTPYLGTFSLDDPADNDSNVSEPVGTTPGSVAWHFDMTNQEIAAIPTGTVLTQAYDVTVADSHGAAVTQTVSVSIGSAGGDHFEFHADNHVGANTIVNLDTTADIIELDGYGFDDEADLVAALSSNGADAQHGDAVLDLGNGDSITVAGVTQNELASHLSIFHTSLA